MGSLKVTGIGWGVLHTDPPDKFALAFGPLNPTESGTSFALLNTTDPLSKFNSPVSDLRERIVPASTGAQAPTLPSDPPDKFALAFGPLDPTESGTSFALLNTTDPLSKFNSLVSDLHERFVGSRIRIRILIDRNFSLTVRCH